MNRQDFLALNGENARQFGVALTEPKHTLRARKRLLAASCCALGCFFATQASLGQQASNAVVFPSFGIATQPQSAQAYSSAQTDNSVTTFPAPANFPAPKPQPQTGGTVNTVAAVALGPSAGSTNAISSQIFVSTDQVNANVRPALVSLSGTTNTPATATPVTMTTQFPAPPISSIRPAAPPQQLASVVSAASPIQSAQSQAISISDAEVAQSITQNYANLASRYGSNATAAATLINAPLTDDQALGLDLATLLRRTVDQDPRVGGLEFQRATNDASADALRAAWKPRLETSFESNYSVLTGQTNDAILGVRQRLFDFGQTDAALQTVEARKILAGARIDSQRFAVAGEFLSAYLSALTATRGINADAAEIAALEQSLTANQRLADSGSASITAARESQLALNQSKSRQAERRLTLQQAAQQLSSLSGVPGLQPDQSKLEQFVGAFLPSQVEQCIASATANAPEIAIVEAQIVEASRELEEARLGRLPSIDLVGQTGLRPFGGETDLGLRRNTGFNFSINGDLFDGGVNAAELRRQTLAIRELEKQRASAQRELELDIRRAYSSVNISRELLQTQQSSLGVLENLVSDRQRQADGGVGLIQDVLAAQVQLEQAKNALTDIQAEYDRERVRLVLLCGNQF